MNTGDRRPTFIWPDQWNQVTPDLRPDIIQLRRELCEKAHHYWDIADTATNCSHEHRAMHRHLADGYKDCYHKLGKILGIPWQDERFTKGWEAGRPPEQSG